MVAKNCKKILSCFKRVCLDLEKCETEMYEWTERIKKATYIHKLERIIKIFSCKNVPDETVDVYVYAN